jgi:hypothetical protein
MTWEPYRHPDPTIGRVVSVYLNEDKTLIKRYFIPNGITVNGKVTEQTPEYIEQKWITETNTLLRFQNKEWVPKLVDINYEERYIIQEYYGLDLMLRGFDDIPDIEDQVVEIYKYFKEINMYKLNGALPNMTKLNGKVIMFDFKYMRERSPELKPYALIEIHEWLSEISPNISKRLEELV